MHWIERVERVGRFVLWLALASAAVIAPLSYIRQRRAEAEQREAARVEAQAEAAKKAAEELAEKQEKKTEKSLSLAAMGQFLVGLDVATAEGHVWFTNVSPRAGVICVVGIAENQTTQKTSTSLPACHDVPAYGSAIRVPLMFAGGDLKGVCQTQGACRLEVKDAVEDAQ
jgi:hypothetical protein